MNVGEYMKKLNELYNTNYSTKINNISINSKQVTKGDIFVCVKGINTDRHDFIDEAINNGASAIVVSHDVGEKNVPVIKVEDTNKELHRLSKIFYDKPDEKLTMIGITGTDGKTSTTTIIQTLLGKDNCGYIGTNGYSYKNIKGNTDNTTPECHKLYSYFNEFVNNGCKYCSMETSSEAFFRNRLEGIEFDISGITNITKEHLNSHGSYENYIDCKCQLFRQTKKDGYCVLNKDDKEYEKCKSACNGKIVTYGKGKDNTLQILDYKIYPNHTDIIYKYENKEFKVKSPLLGEFNVYNLLAGMTVAKMLGVDAKDILSSVNSMSQIPGRLNVFEKDDKTVIVDFAHTPDSFEKTLSFLRPFVLGKLYVIFGCVGYSDKQKRMDMGLIANKYSDSIILTTDNRDFVNFEDICKDIKIEITKECTQIEDRKTAIKKALSMLNCGDVLCVLGKGAEDFQKVNGKRCEYSDLDVVKELLNKKD